MINLLNGVKFPTMNIERVVPTRQTTLDNTFHITQVKAIENGSRKRGVKRREADDIALSSERTDSNAIERLQLRPPEKRICTSDVNRKIELTRKFLPLLFQDCH